MPSESESPLKIWEKMPLAQQLRSARRVYPQKWVETVIKPLTSITLDEWQNQLLIDGKHKRILLNVHRQAGKSTICAIKAIHKALFWDNQTVLIISPTQRQSSELHHTIRKLLKEISGDNKPTVDNVTSTELPNGSRIISLPGSEWTIRSYHADLIICDEAAGIPDEVFAALSPMLLTTNGTMILLSTPQGQEGFFWEAYNRPDIWFKYEKTVRDNPRMNTPEKLAFLEQEKITLGSRLYSQEYECQFLGQIEGGMFKREWFKTGSPFSDKALRCRYWDKAATSGGGDWTVGVLMATENGRFCIEDVQRIQGSPAQVQSLIRRTAERDGKNVRIRMEQEPGSSGVDVIDLYARNILYGYDFRADKVTGPKDIRAGTMAAAFENGNIDIVNAPWNKEFIDELCAFPIPEVHDDQVDAASGAFRELTAVGRPSVTFL